MDGVVAVGKREADVDHTGPEKRVAHPESAVPGVCGRELVPELMPALGLSELPDLGRDIYALVEQRTTARIPNWQELLPTEAFDEPTAD
jgi:hypothetical protein